MIINKIKYMDYSEFIKFIKTLSNTELVRLQCDSRESNDTETVNCVLKELANRAKNKIGK